ncbi:PKD domain-containing protein [Parabacteroides sp. PF5-9]|uniref:PKD domain-containing protein n=1 Tax=Parabacteroides sp. PF5-9 TaxID=1742404 RepID=UPI002474C98A|nr:PKD domain-containing protein [Parabacteroides sp. PF5-9]MDH6358700.1 hypothetical protein [Parabacteroides sp. PF5-9]
MKKFFLICFSLTTVFCVQAQKEANNWVFGNNAGLTWNTTRSFQATGLLGTANDTTLTNLPDFLTGSVMSMLEGCFSLSDADGNLLFYSNGSTIYNAAHGTMANGTGLGGDSSSAQSGIIFPYPGHPNQYIAVSAGATNSDRVEYCIVDMTANGGLGAVTTKNVKLTGYSGTLGESVTSILHANGEDYWIVVPGKGTSSAFNAWLVTSSGVTTTPVITTLTPPSLASNGSRGYIKFTPDGKHFAWATFVDTYLYWGDFDAATGQFSNIKNLTYPDSGNAFYGVEFTASGKYLYVSGVGSGKIYAYDFEALLATSNPASVTPQTFLIKSGSAYALQLGPDGRIYLSIMSSRNGYIIDNPEEFSNLRLYELTNFLPSGSFQAGLPSFAANWFNVSFDGDDSFCVGTPQTFNVTIESVSGVDEVSHTEWDFGDGSAIITDTNVNGTQSHTHTYAEKGVYTITVRVFKKSDGSEMTNQRQRFNVKASSCVLPVNHNISTMEYY